MSSATSRFSATSPISSVQEKVSATQRSSPACSMRTNRPPCRCLRSSMQNMGGFAGFSVAICVRWMRG